MPNWCNIVLTINGSDADVEAFRSKWKNRNLMQFSDFVPLPPEKENDWYDWQVENWGTKWDLGDDNNELYDGPGGLTISATTAWSPPIAFLHTVAKMYPMLVFGCSYHEEAMMFCGYQEWRKGERDLRIHYSYESDKELRKLLRKHDDTVTSAWSPPWTSDSSDAEEEEDEDEEEDEETKADEKIESPAEQS